MTKQRGLSNHLATSLKHLALPSHDKYAAIASNRLEAKS